MTLAAGYLATISINGVTYSDFANQASRSATHAATDKTKLGSDRVQYLQTLGDSTISVQCHADTSLAAAVVAADESTVPISYALRPGALGTVDLGQFSGDCIMTDYTYDAAADSEWNLNIELQGTGQYVYTQPV